MPAQRSPGPLQHEEPDEEEPHPGEPGDAQALPEDDHADGHGQQRGGAARQRAPDASPHSRRGTGSAPSGRVR